ncbi:MAG TPA: hypothetical protein DIS90_05280 [Cytophagales bacterium]|nr:hypothetical protein [Cytophagales bacterium]
MIKKILTVGMLLLISDVVKAQSNKLYLMIDYVNIVDNNVDEAKYYYQNNWEAFRKAAQEAGYIHSYRLLVTQGQGEFDIVLITAFANQEDLNNVESNFEKIIGSIRPGGPIFLNNKKPNDFRKNEYSIRTQTASVNLENVEREIEQILKQTELFSLSYMNADFESLANSYTADAKILPPGAGIIEGREAIKKRWILPDGVRILLHKVTPSEITVQGNWAYDLGYYEGKTRKKNGEEVAWKGKYLIVWKKETGTWKMYADAWNGV